MFKKSLILIFPLILILLIIVAWQFVPTMTQQGGVLVPATIYNRADETASIEKPCSNEHPDWRPTRLQKFSKSPIHHENS